MCYHGSGHQNSLSGGSCPAGGHCLDLKDGEYGCWLGLRGSCLTGNKGTDSLGLLRRGKERQKRRTVGKALRGQGIGEVKTPSLKGWKMVRNEDCSSFQFPFHCCPVCQFSAFLQKSPPKPLILRDAFCLWSGFVTVFYRTQGRSPCHAGMGAVRSRETRGPQGGRGCPLSWELIEAWGEAEALDSHRPRLCWRESLCSRLLSWRAPAGN